MWKKNLITPEEYKLKIEKTLDELVNKQAWLGRLLKKTHKINFYNERKFICHKFRLIRFKNKT